MNQLDISRIAAQLWKNESSEIKAKYSQLQIQERIRFQTIKTQRGGEGSDIRDLFYKHKRPNAAESAKNKRRNRGGGCRPVYTFIRYRNFVKDKLYQAGFEFNQIELSRISSKLWEAEPLEVRAKAKHVRIPTG